MRNFGWTRRTSRTSRKQALVIPDLPELAEIAPEPEPTPARQAAIPDMPTAAAAVYDTPVYDTPVYGPTLQPAECSGPGIVHEGPSSFEGTIVDTISKMEPVYDQDIYGGPDIHTVACEDPVYDSPEPIREIYSAEIHPVYKQGDPGVYITDIYGTDVPSVVCDDDFGVIHDIRVYEREVYPVYQRVYMTDPGFNVADVTSARVQFSSDPNVFRGFDGNVPLGHGSDTHLTDIVSARSFGGELEVIVDTSQVDVHEQADIFARLVVTT